MRFQQRRDGVTAKNRTLRTSCDRENLYKSAICYEIILKAHQSFTTTANYSISK